MNERAASDPGRRLYVISDLHLGGVYGTPGQGAERGFRLCTQVPVLVSFVDALTAKPAGAPPVELVINGDMVDFLAEREEGSDPWVPFTHDEKAAAGKLTDILTRDQAFTDAVHRYLEKGHRLVILLGNHDLELAMPAVRKRLLELLGVRGHHDFEFIHDGEAYLAGDVLIEHGNRYDKFNVVDQDAMRRIRSLLSRRQEVPDKYVFRAPPGSHMVSTVINPIKDQYRFVDLLKPETGAVIPLLLALEPGFKNRLKNALGLMIESQSHRLAAAAMPIAGGDISSGGEPGGGFGDDIASSGFGGPATSRGADPLAAALAQSLGPDAAGFLEQLDAGGGPGEDISTAETIDRAIGLVGLLLAKDSGGVERRLGPLVKALRAVRGDESFSRTVETDRDTWESAQELAGRGIRHVVFGHTHLPKKIALGGGGYYLNSGTWADVVAFPQDLVAGTDAEALPLVREFVERIRTGDFRGWTMFHPTYVRVDLGADEVATSAELCDYKQGDPV